MSELSVKPKEYVLVRYIAYDAHHDLNAKPLPEKAKKQIITELAKRYKVFVSLEKSIDDPFYDKYKLSITPEKMHDVEANAKFMITEGATMASECFVLGVPYLYLNPLRCGYIDYQCENYPERAYQTTDTNQALEIINRLCQSDIENDKARKDLENITIDPTAMLEWFVEDYPESMWSDYWGNK